MKVAYFDLSRQFDELRDRILPALERVCETSQFILGSEVYAFEKEFAEYVGAHEAVAVASGTAALHVALEAVGIGPDDEVITTPLTFVATCEAISYTGAKPVFVDVDPRTRNLDFRHLDGVLTERTRAIVPVHLYGQPADMAAIGAFARMHDLAVIEDCAHAQGATYGGRHVGRFGQAGCFSFYPATTLGAYGEGGIVVTDNPELAERMRNLRNHGQPVKHCHTRVGYNYCMDGLQGAVLRIKLKELDRWTRRRRQIARAYARAFANTGLGVPVDPTGGRGVFHLYPVTTPDPDALARWLDEQDIGTAMHYTVPLHLQPAYAELGRQEGDFPVAERLARQSLSLPLYPEMTDREVQAVIDAVLAFRPMAQVDAASPERIEEAPSGVGAEADVPAEPARMTGNVRYRRVGDIIRAFWTPRGARR